jgi:hypothetical protein
VGSTVLSPDVGGLEWRSGQRRSCAVPPERQLQVAELRRAEVARGDTLASSSPTSTAVRAPVVPHSGPTRLLWLRERLAAVLAAETLPCPASAGSTAEVLLALFERSTGEPFSPSPGVSASQRVTAMGRSLGLFISQGMSPPLDPPLARVLRAGRAWYYNRAPRVRLDLETWRQGLVGSGERTPAARASRLVVNAGLADWLRNHKFLREVPAEQGESGMALLLLWEVDHGCAFPSEAGDNRAGLLASFSRRLRAAVAKDGELQGWLVAKSMGCPLAPGLPPSYHARWSVRICPPPGGMAVEWYRVFAERWKEYLLSLAAPPAAVAPPSSALGGALAHRHRSASPPPAAKRRRAVPPTRPRQPEGPVTIEAPTGPTQRRQASAVGLEPPAPQRKRQALLGTWLQPRTAPPPEHGRAAEGPPT